MKVKVKLSQNIDGLQVFEEEIELRDHSDHAFKAISPDTLEVVEMNISVPGFSFTVRSKAIADFITSKLNWQYQCENESGPYSFSFLMQLTKQEVIEELASVFDETTVVE